MRISVWKSRYIGDVSTPPSLAYFLSLSNSVQRTGHDKENLDKLFCSLDVYKHVLRKCLASIETMLQGQCTKQPFFHVIIHKQPKVNSMLLKNQDQITMHMT